MLPILTAEHGLLFRITHVANIPWLLTHGLHAPNGAVSDPNFVTIGNPDLIDRRTHRRVPIPPGGTLPDYIPFYLTPKSIMLLNIATGWNGIKQRPNHDIGILVSSCAAMAKSKVAMLYTDRHAYTGTARWSDNAGDLATLVDWEILRGHDFAPSDGYPDKNERYQAEALAHKHVPPGALLGIGCVDDAAKHAIEASAGDAGSTIRIVVRREWYF